MAVAISSLQFEHHWAALGIGESSPRISWRFEGDYANWTQSGYDLEISKPGQSSEVFHIDTEDSILVPWPSVALRSGESATVRVKAFGAEGQPGTPWSAPASVEPGLLSLEDWEGALTIAPSKSREDLNATQQPALFRKKFEIDEGVQTARLYITALGLYEAELNGQRVGDLVLAPGWQSYAHRHVYDTYDIRDQLITGNNAIGVSVGEGWFSGRLVWGGGINNIWGQELGLLSLLKITYTNGTTQHIASDESWHSSTGPILASSIYVGERYDARLQPQGWSSADFDASSWASVKKILGPSHLVAPDGPPVRRIEEVVLKNIITSPSGKTVLDFGQNLVGWLKIRVSGPSGTTIKLVHAEVLERGEIGTRPLRDALQTDYVILRGEDEEVWEPKFTFHGFRYVEVSGWPQDSEINAESVVAIVVHTDMERVGYFECSDPLLNQLHSNVIWSMKGNFLSIPTDCPQRDERLGWTGDAFAFAPTADYLFNTAGFWKSWMKDVNREQIDFGGIPPIFVPHIPNGWSQNGMPSTAVWGDIAVGNPYNNFFAFGDADTLREQYEGAKLWLGKGVKRNQAGLWDRSVFQFGDWLDPLAPPNDPGRASTHKDLVADSYLIHVTRLLAGIAGYLNNQDERDQYDTWANNLTAAYQDEWIDNNGFVANETQTGLALPLLFGLFRNDDEARKAADRLRQVIVNNEFKVGTGFAGTHILGLALDRGNQTDVFYQMIKQTGLPGWLYQVVMNGTTTWERWDSMLPNGDINPGGMTSFNHYAYGSVADWMHKTIGGIAPLTPGYKTVKIAPRPGGNITSSTAKHITPYGEVSVSWHYNSAGVWQLSGSVPPNSRAEITLPAVNGKEATLYQVGSGSFSFEV